MTRQDLIIATIRTAVPAAIGYLLAQLVAATPGVAGWIVTIDEVLAVSAPGFTVVVIVNAAAVGLAVGAYYWAARELGRRFPVLEKWLLGRSATPSYIDAGTAGTKPSVVTSLVDQVQASVAEIGATAAAEPADDGGASLEGPIGDFEPKHRA